MKHARSDYEVRILSARTQLQADEVTEAARDVLAERRRQIEAEGWSASHDDGHMSGEMARAAACYALSSAGWKREALLEIWPVRQWVSMWFKPTGRRRDLVKGAALMIAEIERLDRLAALQAKSQPEGGE